MYTSEILYLKRKFGQWQEDPATHKQANLGFYEYVEAIKLTGDLSVPAGQVSLFLVPTTIFDVEFYRAYY